MSLREPLYPYSVFPQYQSTPWHQARTRLAIAAPACTTMPAHGRPIYTADNTRFVTPSSRLRLSTTSFRSPESDCLKRDNELWSRCDVKCHYSTRLLSDLESEAAD